MCSLGPLHLAPTRDLPPTDPHFDIFQSDSRPYGRQLAPDGIHIETNVHEQTILREIRRLQVRGYALVTIAEQLNAGGLRNRRGRPWKRSFAGNYWSDMR